MSFIIVVDTNSKRHVVNVCQIVDIYYKSDEDLERGTASIALSNNLRIDTLHSLDSLYNQVSKEAG